MPKSLSEIQIRDIMTSKVITARADDNVMDIAKTLVEKRLHGIPVVDRKSRLIGMISTRELLDSKGVYLPTAIQLMQKLHVIHGEDIASVDGKLQALKKLRAEDVMNRDPFYLDFKASLEQAAEAFVLRHEEVLPVVSQDKTLVGIVAKGDVLKSLINPLESVAIHPAFTVVSENKSSVVEEVGKKFVVVSRGRARFWYGSLFIFLLLGVIIAVVLILRIQII